jgi:hypothetical protein
VFGAKAAQEKFPWAMSTGGAVLEIVSNRNDTILLKNIADHAASFVEKARKTFTLYGNFIVARL